jgi:hypothetical protein
MQHAVTHVVGASNYSLVRQKIESVRTLAGKAVTVSFWAKADANKPITVEFIQNFGTGGSPSAEVNGGTDTSLRSKISITTTWTKYTFTTTLPSMSGKTLGSIGNNFLGVVFWFDAGSSFNTRTDTLGHQSGTFDIAQVQVEEGSVATPFEQRPVATELAMCLRYYELLAYPSFYFPSTTTSTMYIPAYYQVQKRVTPTVGLPSSTNAAFNNAGSAITPTTWSTASTTDISLSLNVGNASLGGVLAGSVTLDAEL